MAPLTLADASDLLERFSTRRVTVLGDLVADHYVYGQTDRVSREAPVLIVRYESSEVKLGGAANAAANVHSLGGQVRAVGVLGKDEMGDSLRREFTQAGIELRSCGDATVETETKMRILAGGLHTTRQQMLRVDRGNRKPFSPVVEADLQRILEEAAKDSDAILVSDYGLGVCGEATRSTLRNLVASGVRVCVDSRYGLSELKGMTVCKPNEPELENLTGVTIRDEKSLTEAAKRAMDLLQCQVLHVTRGRHGAAVFERSGATHFIPVHGIEEAVDVTGAGDTVIATFTLALAAGATPLVAAQLANVCPGAVVVQKQGTGTVSRAELLVELTPT